ncbi:MAG: 30S ribosome-binding factor RbfA [Hyphomonadaceae bacterium]|nr:30S ribosome-binding factor RbfA [Hyphomonadaceae bacterium]
MSRRDRKPAHAGPSQRQLRAGELVRHALVDVLAREDLRDPDLVGVSVTIGEVRASPDLKHMTAFVAPLGVGDAAKIAEALTRASGFIRSRLAKSVDMKFTPQLHFIPDVSYDEATHIDRLLRRPEVARDLAAPDARKDDE